MEEEVMDEAKLVEMAESVAEIRGLTKEGAKRMDRVEALLDKSTGSMVQVEKSMVVLEDWRTDVDTWRNSMGEDIQVMKADVAECKRNNILSGLDKTTMLKVIALLVASLVAGGAGGQAVADLVKLLMQVIGG